VRVCVGISISTTTATSCVRAAHSIHLYHLTYQEHNRAHHHIPAREMFNISEQNRRLRTVQLPRTLAQPKLPQRAWKLLFPPLSFQIKTKQNNNNKRIL